MCVKNLPRVALDSRAAGIRTHDLLIASLAPCHYANEPHRKGMWHVTNLASTFSRDLLRRTCDGVREIVFVICCLLTCLEIEKLGFFSIVCD